MRRMFVFIVIALVFLSGCTGDEATTTAPVSSYEGMSTSAYAGSLPSSVYEGELIPMQFLVENKGDYNVDSGDYFLKIKGINPAVLGLDENDLKQSSSEDMDAISSFGDETIVSGQEVITVSDSACYNNDLENDLTLSVHAKSCYIYGTTASASACFVEISGTGDGICLPSGFKTVTNTIAPIAVTEFAQSPAGENNGNPRYRFRVKVQNMGPGTVFDKNVEDGLNSCDDISRSDENVVYIDSIMLDGAEIDNLIYEGEPSGDSPNFRLDSTGTGRFSFIIEQESDLEYEGDLDIEFSYAYTQTDVFRTIINALPDQAPNCP